MKSMHQSAENSGKMQMKQKLEKRLKLKMLKRLKLKMLKLKSLTKRAERRLRNEQLRNS